MPVGAGEWIALVVFGALLGLDHAAWPSLLWSQPLVAGGFAGWVGGHAEAGFAAGAVVQMLAMAVQPVGGTLVAEAWIGGFAAAVCAPPDVTLQGSAWLDDPRLTVPAVIGVAAAASGRGLLLVQRTIIGRLAEPVALRLQSGDTAGLDRLQGVGIGLHALRGALMVMAVVVLAPAAARALDLLGLEAPAGRIALALAAAALTTCAPRGRRWRWVGAGLVAGAAWTVWS